MQFTSSLSTEAAYTGVLGVSTGKNPEDSSQASVEAMQWVLHTYPSVMTGVIENISHSRAKICRNTILHMQY
jgi:hypothetical protein